MTNSSSVQEHLKIKRMVLDTWTINERLRLASFVEKNGNQNWASVSRSMKNYFQEPEEWSWKWPRPVDWYSPKNCAQQFALLLDSVETPKRKKRSGGSEETQVQTIKRTLLKLRDDEIENTRKLIQTKYWNLMDQIGDILADDQNALNSALANIEKRETEKAREAEEYQRWLKEREERRIELERARRPVSNISLITANIRRESSLSEPSSDADSPLSEPLAVDVPEELSIKPPTVAPPVSPLLTSLLKSPAGASPALLPPPPVTPPGSILHSAITSPLRSVPSITGRIITSPITVSPNMKSLVSSALGALDDQKPIIPAQSPSQGAPTLSMLLELPPSLPGKPLPVLPAPPPYSGHLGPPPPYSQATQYLQKQRAEQAAQAAQLAIKNELILSTTLSSEAEAVQPKIIPKIDIDLDDIEEVIAVDVSRTQYNTTDHDYMEPKREEFNPTPLQEPAAVPVEVVETKVERNELDVFDFEEEENETETTYKKTKKEATKIYIESEPDIEEIVGSEVTVDEVVTVETCIVEQEILTEPIEPEPSNPDDTGASQPGDEVCVGPVEGGESDLTIKEELIKKDVVHEEIIEENVDSVVPAVEPEVKTEPVTETKAVPEVIEVEDVKEEPVMEMKPVGVKRRRGTNVDSIPNSPAAVSDEEKEYKAWKKSVQMVHSRIEGHKSASLFLRPINNDQAPDYSNIVHKSLDLSMIKRNIESGLIRTSEEYLKDILHMFFNAHTYNKTRSVVFNQAVEMREDSLEHISVMMDLRGESPTWWKRPRAQRETTKTRLSRTSVAPTTRASVKSTKRTSGSSDSARKKIKRVVTEGQVSSS